MADLTTPLQWGDLPQAMTAAELDMAKALFGQRLTDAIGLLTQIAAAHPGCVSANDEQLTAFCDDYADTDTFNLCCQAGLIDQIGSGELDDYRAILLPKGQELYARLQAASPRNYLLALASRFESSDEEDVKLDVLAEVALFEPNDQILSCRPHSTGTKIVMLDKVGVHWTFDPIELTADRPATAILLRDRAAKLDSEPVQELHKIGGQP